MENLFDLSRPLEILYCWQALMVAATAAGSVRAFTAMLDAYKGPEWRKKREWIGLVMLPTMAVFIGAFVAVFIPIRPDVLDTYLEKLPEDQWLARSAVHALWGGACGQFSSYVYDRLVDILRAGAPILERALNTVKSTAGAKAAPTDVIDDDTDDPGKPLDR